MKYEPLNLKYAPKKMKYAPLGLNYSPFTNAPNYEPHIYSPNYSPVVIDYHESNLGEKYFQLFSEQIQKNNNKISKK
jgi:hypothetical protein